MIYCFSAINRHILGSKWKRLFRVFIEASVSYIYGCYSMHAAFFLCKYNHALHGNVHISTHVDRCAYPHGHNTCNCQHTLSAPCSFIRSLDDIWFTRDVRKPCGALFTSGELHLRWIKLCCEDCLCVWLCDRGMRKEKQWILSICKYVYVLVCSRGVPRKCAKTWFNSCVRFVHRRSGNVGLLCPSFHPSWSAAMLCLASSMYPCCKDNDVMNGGSEGESGRKSEFSRLMPRGCQTNLRMCNNHRG